MKNFTLCLFFVLFSTFSFSQSLTPELDFALEKLSERGEVYFTFNCSDPSLLLELTEIISIDNYKNGLVYAYANSQEFNEFLSFNLDFVPVYDYYNASKALTMATTVAEMANWDRYPTHAVYEEMMQDFVDNYPSLARLETIGTSINGWPILCLVISDNVSTDEDEPEFWWSSSMHGDETTGIILTLRFADYLLSQYGDIPQVTNLVDNIEIYINPMSNPDGTFYGSATGTSISTARRGNANNVDLNRNFPRMDGGTVSNQQEIQIMMNYATANDFVMSANIHGGAEVANFPWDTYTTAENAHADDTWWDYVAHVYADNAISVSGGASFTDTYANGVTEGGDWYVITGSRQDYMNYFQGVREITMEVSTDKNVEVAYLNDYWNYNQQAMLDYTEQVVYGFRGIVADACTGNPLTDVKVEIVGHDEDNSFVYSSAPVGNYHRPIYAGTWNVTFSKTGYQTQTQSVTVTNDNSTRLDINLIPNGVAVPNFSASSVNVIIGSDVDFTDLTSGAVTSMDWSFEGGNPATSTDQNPTVNYASDGVFDVSLEVQSAGCTVTELKEDYITVYIPGAPVAEFTSDVTTTCTGIVQFTNSSVDAETYDWNFGDGNTSTDENPLHTYTESGIFTVSLTAYNAYGDDNYTVTDMITVNLPEAPTTTGDESCGPASLTLTATGLGTLAWYDAPTEGNEVTTGTSYTNTFSETTTLYVQSGETPAFYSGGNSDILVNGGNHTASNAYYLIFTAYEDFRLLTVQVNSATEGNRIIQLRNSSSVEIASKTVYLNTGINTVTLDFDISVGTNYQLKCATTTPNLYRNNAGVSWPYLIGDAVSITGTNATDAAYYYYFYNWQIMTGDECVSARTPVTATINDLPIIDLGTAQTQCGGTVNLDAGAGFTSYVWNGTSGSQTYEVSTTDNYAVEVEDINGCTAGDNVDITINTVPTAVNVSGGTTQCGGIVDLDATGGTGGTIYWQGTTQDGTSTVTPTTAQSVNESGTYYFRSRSAEGCWGDEGSAVVVINEIPAAVVVSGGGTQCGGSMTLTATNGGEGTIYWQNTTSGGTSTANPATQETISVSGTYYFRARSAEGCWGDEGSASVTIEPGFTVEATAVDESAPDANDGSVTVEMTGGTAPFTGTWTPSGTTNTDGNSMTLSGLTGGNYSVIVEDANGCIAEAGAIVNTVGATPVAAFEADVTEACDNLTVQFTDLSTNNPTSWAWDFGDGANTNEQNPIHNYTAPGLYTVSLIVDNGIGSDTETIENYILIGETPLLEMSMTQATVLGNDGTATVTVTGGDAPYSYEWNVAGNTETITSLSAGEYCVTVTESGDNCQASDCIFVTQEGLNYEPVADFVADVTEACLTLTAQFTDLSTNDPTSWEWNFGDDSNSTEQNPEHTYSVPGVYTVTLTVTNTEGSDEEIKTDYISVYAKPELSFIITHETGVGNSDGVIELTIVGGAAPYVINWSNNQHELINSGLSAGLYSVAVIDDNGCMATGFAEVQVVSAITSSSLTELSVYPNPSDGNFFVESDELIKSIKIYNAIGGLCFERNISNKIIEISDIKTPGLYIIHVETESKIINQRIIIE